MGVCLNETYYVVWDDVFLEILSDKEHIYTDFLPNEESYVSLGDQPAKKISRIFYIETVFPPYEF